MTIVSKNEDLLPMKDVKWRKTDAAMIWFSTLLPHVWLFLYSMFNFFGFVALNFQAVKFPKNSYIFVQDVLGKKFNNPLVQQYKQRYVGAFLNILNIGNQLHPLWLVEHNTWPCSWRVLVFYTILVLSVNKMPIRRVVQESRKSSTKEYWILSFFFGWGMGVKWM